MQRQFEILNRILELLEVEVNHDFQTSSCMFVPIGDDGERTAETTFFYKRDGTEINAGLSNENIFELVDLAVELQTKMKAHTGGEWSDFFLKSMKAARWEQSFNILVQPCLPDFRRLRTTSC